MSYDCEKCGGDLTGCGGPPCICPPSEPYGAKLKHCTWCNNSQPQLMVAGGAIPMVCGSCGTGLDHVNYKVINQMLAELKSENERLSQQICDECTPAGSGWVENRVDGRVPCTCMLEAEPYQILENKLAKAISTMTKTVELLKIEQEEKEP